jgi:WD40 repeat protein
VDKYITCGHDGTFRLWNCADLRHFKTVSNSNSWITDTVYLPTIRKLVFSTMDRAISYYDIHRGSYELTGRVYASGSMGVPLCLASLQVRAPRECGIYCCTA